MKEKQKILLIVMDGWGIAPSGKGNCISRAKTPNYDYYTKNFPCSQLKAAGNNVGLPEGSQGNSEVGHLHLGAGKIIWQPLELINRKIKDKSFFKNKVLLEAIEHCKKNNSALHLMGLCSDEGVHASTEHLIALIELAKQEKFRNVFVHCFLDGRDVPEKSASKYIKIIEDKLKQTATGKIASVVGRYYAMDRDKNWERTQKAFELLTEGKGFTAKNALEAVEQAYERGDKTDYYIQPIAIIDENKKPIAKIENNDGIIFFNFRTDRPKQLSHALVDKEFDHFKREKNPKVFFTSFTEYEKNIKSKVAFSNEKIETNLGSILSKNGFKQLRLAETEKYAHVTYFFNSQIEEPYSNEDRIMIPSSKVKSYDLKPEMSAYEITDEAIKQISSEKYNFILLNFANCDLVGHSAKIPAVIKAVETVDKCTGKVIKLALAKGFDCIVTADHGSAEDKLYKDGLPKPAHSTNQVPFILISNNDKLNSIKPNNGELIDVAPTILKLIGIKTKVMEGKALI